MSRTSTICPSLYVFYSKCPFVNQKLWGAHKYSFYVWFYGFFRLRENFFSSTIHLKQQICFSAKCNKFFVENPILMNRDGCVVTRNYNNAKKRFSFEWKYKIWDRFWLLLIFLMYKGTVIQFYVVYKGFEFWANNNRKDYRNIINFLMEVTLLRWRIRWTLLKDMIDRLNLWGWMFNRMFEIFIKSIGLR